MSWINNDRFNNKHHDSFLIFGNLLFYPSGDIAQQRFFFFKTLLSDYSKMKCEPYRSAYITAANQIGNQAVSVLSQSPLINDENLENTIFFQNMQQALKILQNGVVYEQHNEMLYIQDKLQKLKTVFAKTEDNEIKQEIQTIENLLSQLNTNNGIDYKALINLINIVTQGLKNTTAIYKDNIRHMQEVNDAYKKAKQNYLNQIGGLNKSGKNKSLTPASEKRLKQRFDKQAQAVYLQRKTFSKKKPNNRIEEILKKQMKDIKNIDSKVAQFVTESIKKVLNNPNLINTIKSNLEIQSILNGQSVPSEEKIKHAIVTAALELASQNIENIIEAQLDYQTMAQEIADYVTQKSTDVFNIQIENYYDNFGFLGKHLKFFETLDEKTASAKQLYEALQDLIKAANDKDNPLTVEQQYTIQKLNLNKKNIFQSAISLIHKIESYARQVEKNNKEIEPLELEFNNKDKTKEKVQLTLTINEEGKLQISGNGKFTDAAIIGDSRYLNFKEFNPTTLESLIKSLKTRTSQLLKDRLLSIIQETASKKIKQEVTHNLKQGLENIRVSIGGPKWSEILPQIQAGLKDGKVWTGPLNLKNDNIIITCAFDGHIKTNFSFNSNDINKLSDVAQKTLSNLEENYTSQYAQAINKDLKEFSKNKQYNQYTEYAKKFLEQESIRQEYITKTIQTIKELDEKFQNNKINEKEYNDQKDAQIAFLNELENTLHISSTSKTYNNYMDNIGFIGGSVGSGIAAQIDHLNQLFEAAGMPLSSNELNWLIFAAINNSSLSVVGHSNESLIENYLGSLATFALFSESGEELKILEKMKSVDDISASTPKIMHLFFVNGTYYPGSYVLQQALEHVQLILDDMENVIMSNNSSFQNGVKITNTVAFSDLPNNDNYKNKQKQYNTRPWQTVARTAEKKTNIHIIFLAGLLSIVTSLMNQLNEIELPT